MIKISLPTKRPFNWKVFLFLVVLDILAMFALIPYNQTLLASSPDADAQSNLVRQMAVNIPLHAVLIALGLLLAGRIGLGLPFVEGWLDKKPLRGRFGGVLVFAVIAGVVVGFATLGLDLFAFGPFVEAELESVGYTPPETLHPPAWQGLLASFFGGVTEEIMVRLFLLTLLAWLGSLVGRDEEGRPTLAVLWIATVLAALAFGAGHLPGLVDAGLPSPLPPLLVTRTILLNALVGVVFGWLYWSRGLESAMLAHFSADIVLHVLSVLALPLLA
jgi:membrane protease YdiL (CAAX protease family)